MIVKCKTCGLPLTKPLSPLEDMSLMSIKDGTDLVPREHYFVGKGEYGPDMTGHVFANLNDVINTEHHTDLDRLNGCCGLDGQDGPNTVCANGHEVGTECSDCWMAHFIHFQPENILFEG